ncbi:bile acid:sodium symporter family protein [Cellulomonas sp. McL0617]|uniref:bile acid:sodium symporter family protein n=1 Tax=Cellulomonas sp. McL0617 TaxID=3415675 RepID=UPI003CFAE454
MTRVRAWLDPQVIVVLAALALGLFVPAAGSVAQGFDTLRTVAIVSLFFLYGARMATREVWDGLRNARLQGRMLAATYVAFPILGLLVQLVPGLDDQTRHGLLFLSLLPSTVQSSVVFTSIARGNVAGAITGATISNLVGIVVTPLLVGLLLVHGRGTTDVSGIVGQLLLPFVLGQLAQPWIGQWLRAHAGVTRATDRATIALVAYVSVSEATNAGAWDHVTARSLAILVTTCAVLLAAMLTLTWSGGRSLVRPDRVALLMVGSKKSLATGLPMAAVLFTPAVSASVTLPVVVFHQLQLATCAVIARRLASRVE